LSHPSSVGEVGLRVRQLLKMLIILEGAHAFCVNIFGELSTFEGLNVGVQMLKFACATMAPKSRSTPNAPRFLIV
jgi:hypothetical protein